MFPTWMQRCRGRANALAHSTASLKCGPSGRCERAAKSSSNGSHQPVHERVHNTLEAIVRNSRAKLVAFLAAGSGDLAAAEDALSEAFTSALQVWPMGGNPDNPEAWLLTVARRKLIDAVRRQREIPSSEDLEELAGVMTADTESGFPD